MDPLHALTAEVASLSLSSNKAPHAAQSAQEKSYIAPSLIMLRRMQQAGLLKEGFEANEARLGPIPQPTSESRERFKQQQASELKCQFFEGVPGEAYTLYVPYLNLMEEMLRARECGFSPINEIYIPGSGASRIAGPSWYRQDLQSICNHELSDLMPLVNALDLSHIEDADDLDTHFSAENAEPKALSVHYFSIHPEALFIVELIEQHYRQLHFTIAYDNGKSRKEQGFYAFLNSMSNRQIRKGMKSVKIESLNIPWMRNITLSMKEVGEIWQKLEASSFFYQVRDQNWGVVKEVVLNLALDYIFKMKFHEVVQFFHEKAKAFTHYHTLYRECQKGVLRDWNRLTCKDTSGIMQDVLFMRTTTSPKKRIAFQDMQIDIMPSLCGRTHELTIKTSWQAILDKAFRLIRWLDLTFADQKDWALFWFLVTKGYVCVLPDTQDVLQARFLDFCKQKGDNIAAFCKAILEKLDGRSKQDKTLHFAFIFNALYALPEEEFSSQNVAKIWEPLKAVYYDESLDPSWKLIADALLDQSIDYKSLTTLLKKLAYDLLAQPADTTHRPLFKAHITEHNGKMAVQFEMAGFTFLFPHNRTNDLNAFESCKNNLRLQLIARTLYPESTSIQTLLSLVPESAPHASTDGLLLSHIRKIGLSKKDEENLISSIHNPKSFTENLLLVEDEQINSVGLALWKKQTRTDGMHLVARLATVQLNSALFIAKTLPKEEQQKVLAILFEEAIKERNQGKFLQLIYSLCTLCDDEMLACHAALTLFQRGEKEKAVDILYIASEGKSDPLLAQFSKDYRSNTIRNETLVTLACSSKPIYNQLFFLAARAMQSTCQKSVDESVLLFLSNSSSIEAATSAMHEVVKRQLSSSPLKVWMSYVDMQEGKSAFDAYNAGFELKIWDTLLASQYPQFYGSLITKLYRSNDLTLYLQAERLETVANGYVIGHIDLHAKAQAKKMQLESSIEKVNDATFPELLVDLLKGSEQERSRTLFAKWLSKKNLIATLEVLQKTGSRDFVLWRLAFDKTLKEANAKQKKRAVELAKEAVTDTASINTIQEALTWCDFEEFFLQLKNEPADSTLEAMQNSQHALCTKFAGDNFREIRLTRHLLRVLKSASVPSTQMKKARDSLDGYIDTRKADRKELDIAYVKLMLLSDLPDCFLSAAKRLETCTKEEISKEHCELISQLVLRAHSFGGTGQEALHTCLASLSKHYQVHLMQLQDPFYLIMGLALLPPKLFFKTAAEMALSRIKREGALRDIQGEEEERFTKGLVLRLIDTFDPSLIDNAALIVDNFAPIHTLKRDISLTRQIMNYVKADPLQKALQRIFGFMHDLFQTNYSRDPNETITPHQDHLLWVEQRIVSTPMSTLSMTKILSQAVTGYMGYLTYTYNLAKHYPISLVETHLSKVFSEELAKDEMLLLNTQLEFCTLGKKILDVPAYDIMKKGLLCCAYSMLQQAMRCQKLPKKEVISFLEAFIFSKDILEAASLFHHLLCHKLLSTAESVQLLKECLPEQKLLFTMAVTAMVPQIRGVPDEKRKECTTRVVTHLLRRADFFSKQKAVLLIANGIESKIAFDDEKLLQWGLSFADTLKNKASFHEQEINCLLRCIEFCKEAINKETALAKQAKEELLAILLKASLLEIPLQLELKNLYSKLSGA